jgi:hypothetical protein
MKLQGIKCAVCSSAELIAVAPGDGEERFSAGGQLGFLLDAGSPLIGWCEQHAPFLRQQKEMSK